MEKASKGVINKGGHSSPVSIFALKLKVKKPQKNLKKKQISLEINQPIDHFKDCSISTVWVPIFPSISTSFAQSIINKIKKSKFNNNLKKEINFQQYKTKENKKLKIEKQVKVGQNLSSTIK